MNRNPKSPLEEIFEANSDYYFSGAHDCLNLHQIQCSARAEKQYRIPEAKIKINTPFSLNTLHNVFMLW
jgi:hypothetical protein